MDAGPQQPAEGAQATIVSAPARLQAVPGDAAPAAAHSPAAALQQAAAPGPAQADRPPPGQSASEWGAARNHARQPVEPEQRGRQAPAVAPLPCSGTERSAAAAPAPPAALAGACGAAAGGSDGGRADAAGRFHRAPGRCRGRGRGRGRGRARCLPRQGSSQSPGRAAAGLRELVGLGLDGGGPPARVVEDATQVRQPVAARLRVGTLCQRARPTPPDSGLPGSPSGRDAPPARTTADQPSRGCLNGAAQAAGDASPGREAGQRPQLPTGLRGGPGEPVGASGSSGPVQEQRQAAAAGSEHAPVPAPPAREPPPAGDEPGARRATKRRGRPPGARPAKRRQLPSSEEAGTAPAEREARTDGGSGGVDVPVLLHVAHNAHLQAQLDSGARRHARSPGEAVSGRAVGQAALRTDAGADTAAHVLPRMACLRRAWCCCCASESGACLLDRGPSLRRSSCRALGAARPLPALPEPLLRTRGADSAP